MINTRKFGVEIEFVNANRETLAQKLVANGIPCFYEGYNHTTRGHWKIVTDATVRGGYELVSPPLQGEAGLLEVKKVLSIMHECKRNPDMDMVNMSCGLHVHLDASDLDGTDIYWIVKRYKDNETAIDGIMPTSRRGDARWCRSISSSWKSNLLKELNTIEANARQQFRRECKVNVAYAYARHKTIEFRQHSGTTDYNKIANWIEFLQYFVEQSVKIKQSIKIKHDYKPRKNSVMFASIREQVALLGGKLFYKGAWKIINENGETIRIPDNSGEHQNCGYAPLAKLYENNSYKGNLNKEKFLEFMRNYFPQEMSNNDDADESLFAGIPHYVEEFFNMRTTQLRRA